MRGLEGWRIQACVEPACTDGRLVRGIHRCQRSVEPVAQRPSVPRNGEPQFAGLGRILEGDAQTTKRLVRERVLNRGREPQVGICVALRDGPQRRAGVGEQHDLRARKALTQ
jgi:hypothetical protein